ncbi:MAG TPA: DcaP family trimeric outer membrane transporter, partial [Rhodopila sp.]
WGEVKSFVSMDFAASNTNTILNVVEGSTNGYIPRLREGYVSFGGLLAGQTVGTFVDNDSSPELLDFGGQTGINFVARTPQVRYTYLLPMGQSVAVSIEQPNPLVAGPFGTYYEDTNQIPTISSCNPITAITAGVVTGTNITNACLGNAAFFNISQQLAPTFVQRWRIDQPWGHIQIGTTESLYTLNDGSFLNNRQYIGYGAGFSGNTFPGWFGWSKDNITYGLSAGNGIGDQIANNSGLATNFGGNLNAQGITAADSRSNFTVNRKLYDSAVLGRTIPSFGARIGYAHWWTDNLRSNADFSMNHQDVASQLVGVTSTVNKELTLTHVNLIWSPAAFLDLGIEGAWGHRQTVSNAKGDAYTFQSSMKFRF